MRFSHTIRGVTYGFADLKELLAKASPLRSGDELAGICAASAEERVAARLTWRTFRYAIFSMKSSFLTNRTKSPG